MVGLGRMSISYLTSVYCPRFTRPPMNALQPDAMRDYNQGVEEVIPTTKQVDAT